jgi:cyanophycin synthetase
MDHLRLLRVRHLRGPNVWTYRSALEVWIDLGPLEDRPSNTIPGFRDRLVGLLPGLQEHHCGVGERGGFIQRLDSGTMAGHVLEHVVIELLNLGGMPTGFGQTRSTSRRGVYRMAFRARDERVARVALAQGHRLLEAVLREEAFDVLAAVEAVRDEVDCSYLDPSTASIVAAAIERGIPHLRLTGGNLVQLGHGVRQRRIWNTETGRTSAIAHGISRDDALTRSLLASCGVPVADSAPAVRTAGPAVGAAEGTDRVHRLLVVGGNLVAAARGRESSVLADGRTSVQDLVDAQINASHCPGDPEGAVRSRIRCAADGAILRTLRRQGLTPESVPAAGAQVLIQRIGRESEDCTDQVHPEVRRVAELAARLVGLDVAGIDIVADDIGRPLQAQGGVVVEVHAGPGLVMHLEPTKGTSRPVGRAILDHLFAEGEDGRVPIVGIAGSRCTERIARMVAWLLHLSGRQVGLACQGGIWLDRSRVDAGDGTRWDAGRRVLMNHLVEVAVLETRGLRILEDGLPYDRCDVGLVHDLEGHEALGEHDIQRQDQMRRVMRTQIDVVLSRGAAVLNAADPEIAEMAELCDGQAVLYALDANNPAINGHRAAGGRSAFVADRTIMLACGATQTPVGHLPEPQDGQALDDEATLAAVAASWACGVDPDVIVTGVATFGSDLDPYSSVSAQAGARPVSVGAR